MKNKKHILTYSALILLTGCANYNASTLSMLSTENAIQSVQESQVLISWKAYDKEDCKKYLDRNVLAKGYLPVQLTIRNNSSDPMYLSSNNFNIPVSSSIEVADKVHTSTGGRVAAWGIGGLFFLPLFIPAVVDGLKSVEANDALDADYAAKSIKEHTIQAHSSFNGVVFIPEKYAEQEIEMFLVNQKTNQKVGFAKTLLNQM